MEPIDKVLLTLRELDCQPRGGGGQWSARCPCPDHGRGEGDRRPSLQVGVGDDGQALLKCLGGCSTKEVLRQLGLGWSDLFPDRPGDSRKRWAPHAPARKIPAPRREWKPKPKRVYSDLDTAITAFNRFRGAPSDRWSYCDARSEHVGEVVRWDPPGTGKVIQPFARQSDGWVAGHMPAPRPLLYADYLSKLPPGATLHVHEGELCARAAWSLGQVATTCAGGSCAVGQTDWSPLRDKEVVVWPDVDSPGEKYRAAVVEQAIEVGASSVRVMDLRALWPDAPLGSDIADWIEAHSDSRMGAKA